MVAAATAISWFVFGEPQLADVAMVFLLGVVVVAMRFGYGPSLVAAILSAAAFEFFFIPPLFSFAIADVRHVVTFAVLLFVAVVISHLTRRIRDHGEKVREARLRVETERLRSALLGSVSHDLRTPLAVVMGATSALLEQPPADEERRRTLLVTAHEETLRLHRLVRDLLDMTRIEAGALVVDAEPHAIEEIVGAALTRMESRLAGRPVVVRVPADLPLVPLEPVLVEQVLVNLLENATRHTAPGLPVDVSVALGETEIEIDVADRGPGIPPENAERVFEKFYRVHETEGGGVGLGLTICRGIVGAHGGRIWVEAREGGGASFRFTLPRERAR